MKFQQQTEVKVQFLYIHDDCSPVSANTSFDIDLLKVTFNGESIRATRASIEAM
jgi:hypothetical protein